MPSIVSYRVAAIFEVGVYDYDKAFVIMPLSDAQTLLMLGDAVGMVGIQTVDPDHVGDILAPLALKVGSEGVVQDWRSMNASLFQALEVERVVMFWVLSLIILVAVFNILSSLIMMVRAKRATSRSCARWARHGRACQGVRHGRHADRRARHRRRSADRLSCCSTSGRAWSM